METQTLLNYLHHHMEAHHRGQARAMPREELLRNFVWPLIGNDMDDRDFRKLYGQLPVAGCAKGIFIPATKEENKEFYGYMLKKHMTKEAAMKRIEIILRFYPKLDWREPAQEQGRLFG